METTLPRTAPPPGEVGIHVMAEKILIVEDESEIRELIALQLGRQGYQVVEAGSAEQALDSMRDHKVALIILDWMLPGMSGKEFTKTLRSMERSSSTPILFVTAKSAPEDIVEGLDVGADDYLPKPFDNAVLLARVRSLLRRPTAVTPKPQAVPTAVQPAAPSGPRSVGGSVVQFGPLQLDVAGYRAHLEGFELELTRSEFRLLKTLMENQGKVLTRNQLIDQIQGEGVAVVGRTVDTHVFGLRKKLGRFADVIETVRGVGYRIGYLEA